MTDEALARDTDPWTSHEAADSLDVSRIQELILDALAHPRSALTSNEIADDIGLAHNCVSPRLKPLEEKGLVFRAGIQAQPSGRGRTLWSLVIDYTPTPLTPDDEDLL